MRVTDHRRTMSRPARMGNPDGSVEWVGLELAREIVELPLRPPPLKLALVDGANARGIITAVFEPLEPIEQPPRDLRFSDNPDDPAHLLGGFPRHSLAEAAGPAGNALLLAALDSKGVG